MTKLVKKITIGLDILVLLLICIYTAIYILKYEIIFVTANSTFFQSYLNQTVDIVLAALMIIGGVIGAQIGARLGTTIKAEYLRGALAFIVLMVCLKIFLDLTLTPNELFSLSN